MGNRFHSVAWHSRMYFTADGFWIVSSSNVFESTEGMAMAQDNYSEDEDTTVIFNLMTP